ncbi:SMI1/KNR4 family protein [Phyllobacterium leguminum]|uniref:SUKH superfamily protein n=1 Tax=Phyllobacterium leguminum TaxID=314237 RepID=A0A318STI8_9HYPH|nr:SMI1/KNR4 family protein [Phyllobacterium leguminum]PYE85160.1 SUKH superfamily protein [Phyllobacterium leguminum]
MSEQTYREAIRLLQNNGLHPLKVRRPALEDIILLERRLNVRLPRSYRAMLLDFGLLQVESISIAGIGNAGLDGTTSSSVVFSTEKDRRNGLITDTMIQIGVTGYGPFYFIDCAEIDANGEAPVWEAQGNGVSYGKAKIANSFGDFLLNEVHSLLKNLREDHESEYSKYWKERSKDFDH